MPKCTFPHIVSLGPPGTFSDEAAHVVANNQSVIEYKRTFHETLDQVAQDQDQVAVVPIENSVAGIVDQVQDMLVSKDLVIIGEVNIAVRYALLTGVQLDAVTKFYAHPQTNGQTLAYTSQYLSGAVVEFTNSNVESGEMFLKAMEREEPYAAIVPLAFSENFPQLTLATDIQDYPNNTTRFVVVRRRTPDDVSNLNGNKTSIMVRFDADRADLLFELLLIFKKHEINLCRLESRPSKNTLWFYVFFVDFTNNENTERCIEDLNNSPFNFTFLGSYCDLS